MKTGFLFAAIALAMAPAVATAQNAPPPAGEAVPANLDVSRKIAARLVPDGIFMKVMSGTMDQITGGMLDQFMDIPIRELAAMFAKDPSDIKEMGPGTTREIMMILDPAFNERTQLSMKAMMNGMSGVMTQMEPEVREGMALAYANRFSATELRDMDAFFSSPSGQRFAAENMTIMTDPALMKRMQAMMPKIMSAMPDIIKGVEAATAALPKPRKPESLSPAEKQKLADLMGIDVAKMK